jgi:3-oxoacyl-[acyl-carrier protein] reductase
MKLQGKTALVTGASRGIGRGIALALADEGADVAVNYRRRADEAERTVKEIQGRGREAFAIQADVGDFAAVAAMVDAVLARWGRIDVAVANSGVASRVEPVAIIDPANWNRVIGTNLNGVFHTLRCVAPSMIERRSGVMLAVSSIGADTCQPGGAPYHASKAAVNALVRVLAREVAPFGVRANVVAPGLIATDMGEKLIKVHGDAVLEAIPLGRAGEPAEVGKLAAFLASEDAAWITGKIFRIDGGAFTAGG